MAETITRRLDPASDGDASTISYNDIINVEKKLIRENQLFRGADDEFSKNISRQRLKKAGLTDVELKKFDPDGNGFSRYELTNYYYINQIELGKKKLLRSDHLGEIKLIFTQITKAEEFSNFDDMIASRLAEKNDDKVYLKDFRKFFADNIVLGSTDDFDPADDLTVKRDKRGNFSKTFKDFDDFKSEASAMFGTLGLVDIEDRIPTWDKKLKAAYEKYILSGKTRGRLTENEFAATMLDITLGKNSYYALKKDPKNGLRYLDETQLSKMNSVLNPEGKTFEA